MDGMNHPDITSGYNKADIFNYDETTLFLRVPSKKQWL